MKRKEWPFKKKDKKKQRARKVLEKEKESMRK